MTFEVFHFRNDLKNVFVSPEIRSRFVRMDPGEVSVRHSHDLGHEIFLVLDGQAEFEIEERRRVLTEGQLCIAEVGEKHSITCMGEKPMIMYLSVTPHVEPTHTRWTDDGQKLQPSYGPSTRQDRLTHDPTASNSAEQLGNSLCSTIKDLVGQVDNTLTTINKHTSNTLRYADQRNRESTKELLDEMWVSMFSMLCQVRKIELAWNEFSARIDESLEE